MAKPFLTRQVAKWPGRSAFTKAFPVKKQRLVGAQGIPPEEFLTTPIEAWME